jgi:glycosyltransferase involved in cell wall biosynthesis
VKIHLHDFAGHPFQAQLSRSLAARGHTVEHGYSAQHVSGKGILVRTGADPSWLTFLPVNVGAPTKNHPVGLLRFERAYRNVLVRHLLASRPDVTVLCNIPIYVARSVGRVLTRNSLPWVLWHQEISSAAMAEEVRRQLPSVLAEPICRVFKHQERETVRVADAVVAVGPAFLRQYREWQVDRSAVHVLPNWAPLDEIVPASRDNAWAREHGLPNSGLRLMYCGTLRRMHNPMLLGELLAELRRRGVKASLTVVSEGAGVEMLRRSFGDDLRILPFQPAQDLTQVLASADILIAVLEEAAGEFSIPTKVLSYLASGRVVMAFMPESNPIAVEVRTCGGKVVRPTSVGVVDAAIWMAELAGAPRQIRELGDRSRRYAEDRFTIAPITDEFEHVMTRASRRKVSQNAVEVGT